MKPVLASIIVISMLLGASNVNAAFPCGDKDSGVKINGIKTWVLGGAVIFSSPKLNVDADGAPNSYLLDGKGLSYTCDGVVAIENGKRVTSDSDPKGWQQKCYTAWSNAKMTGDYSGVAIFGFLTDKNNKPLVQGEGDSLPGLAYITTTSVHIPETKEGTQKHEVDATTIPYIVLPAAFISKYGVKPGDIAVVFRRKTKKFAFAVYADGGKLGEASVKLHQDIGSNPIVVENGVKRAKANIDDSVTMVVFPNKTTHPVTDAAVWQAEIQTLGAQVLKEFGGLEQLEICAN